MSTELIEMMSDVRDRVIRIETKMEALPELKSMVDSHQDEIVRAKTSLNMLRWLAGIFFVSVPASVYAVVRMFKG